jgi:hypothetical protein
MSPPDVLGRLMDLCPTICVPLELKKGGLRFVFQICVSEVNGVDARAGTLL